MKTTGRHLINFALVGLAALIAAGPARAQSRLSRNNHIRRGGPIVKPRDVSATDVATFQTNLGTLVSWLSSNASSSPSQQSAIANLQSAIAGLTPDQMTQVASSFDVNAFGTAVATLTGTTAATVTLPSTDPPSNLFAPAYGALCQLAGPPSPIPSDEGIAKALDEAIEIAHDASLVADRLCDTILVALGGTNLPACIIAEVVDAIEAALDKARDLLEFCDPHVMGSQIQAGWQNSIVIDTDVNNFANTTTNNFANVNNQLNALNAALTNHTTGVDSDLSSKILAIDSDLANRISNVDNDVINKSTGVDTDLNNHLNSVDNDVLTRDTQIDTEISTFQTLGLRMQIEQTLSAGQIVGLFEVPQANGGYLETVRGIVADTIAKLQAAGQTINSGTKYLALGDSAYAAKQFKAAFANYEAAYTSAVK